MFSYAGALRQYGHSVTVRNECIRKIAFADNAGASTDIAAFHETLTLMDNSENPTARGTPHVADPSVHSALTKINGKIKGGSKGKTSGKSDGSVKNPETKKYVERQIKKTGQTADEIYKQIKCNNCSKVGHIAPDCTQRSESSTGKESGGAAPQSKGRRKGGKKNKNNGNGTLGSVFLASDSQTSASSSTILNDPFVCCRTLSTGMPTFVSSGIRICSTIFAVFPHQSVLKDSMVLASSTTRSVHIVSSVKLYSTLLELSPDNNFYVVIHSGSGKKIARFDLDESDGFYKTRLTGPKPSFEDDVATALPQSRSSVQTKPSQCIKRCVIQVTLYWLMQGPSMVNALNVCKESPSRAPAARTQPLIRR
mmetsp:Transcript_16174/g.23593  ORF Transcript_16174/g.23593 Transcript_16174/m.23593 type:complete len:366 (-) Transcript_16174:37-1134(-)